MGFNGIAKYQRSLDRGCLNCFVFLLVKTFSHFVGSHMY
jgi:hypothetical protein